MPMLWKTVPMGLQSYRQTWGRLWNSWPEGHMWTPCVIMGQPCLHDALQMVLSQRNHKIEAFSSQRAQQPFTERVGLRTLRWGFHDSEPEILYAVIKLRREYAIAIMDEEVVAMGRWDRFAQLLERPRRCGMCGCIDMQEPAGRVFHHDKHVEEAKGRRDHHTEITRHDRLGMIARKGP